MACEKDVYTHMVIEDTPRDRPRQLPYSRHAADVLRVEP